MSTRWLFSASILAVTLLASGCATDGGSSTGRSPHNDGSIGTGNRNAGNEHVVIKPGVTASGNPDQDGFPATAEIPNDLMAIPDAVPTDEPRSAFGNPTSYEVFGQKYVVLSDPRGFKQRGDASWYGKKFQGKLTSSGEPYDMFKMTAAHKTLPIPCYVRVTNTANGKNVIVRVNDRGPFHTGRIIDLSYTAALKLGLLGQGSAPVEIEVVTAGQNSSPMMTASNTPSLATSPSSAKPVIAAQIEPTPEPSKIAPAPPPVLHIPAQGKTKEAEPSLQMATSMAPPAGGASAPRETSNADVIATAVAQTVNAPKTAAVPVSTQSMTSGSVMPIPAAPRWLQAGLFGDASNAATLREQLLKLGIDNVQLKSEVRGANYVHRVLVGPYADPAAMTIMRDRLAEVHLDSLPVPN